MDEPLTNLDAKLREELRVELRELARRLETPVLWVTHDAAEALSMADRVAVLSHGRILQLDTPRTVYLRPVSPLVARQLGSPPMNLIEVRRDEAGWRLPSGELCCSAAGDAPREALLGFRPEHVRLDGGASEALVELVEHLGPQQVVVLRWGGATVHAAVPSSVDVAVHQRVCPTVAPEHCLVWPR
jgi:ABC-type sugar transport system ATPase subunit